MLMTLEMGKTLAESRGEVAYGAEFFRWFSEEAVRISGRWSAAPTARPGCMTMKQPVGPTLMITPWNFPLAMGTRKIGPAIAAGCTMVVKPASQTPLTMLAARRAAPRVRAARRRPQRRHDDARHDRRRHGAAHPRPAAAQADLHRLDARRPLAHGAGRAGHPAGLDGARRQRPVPRLRGRRRRPGRRRRDARQDAQHGRGVHRRQPLLRPRVARRRVQRQAGRAGWARSPSARAPRTASTSARSSTRRPATRSSALVDDAVAKGAKVLVGGSAPEGAGWFYEPTVLADVPTDADMAREEIFGPVAPGHDVPHRRRGDPPRQRHRVRPRRLPLHQATSRGRSR